MSGAADAGGRRRPPFPVGLLAGVLPAGVAVVDALDESFDGHRLRDTPAHAREVVFPAEFDALGDAAPRRRLEFARARICGHAAVAALGHRPEPILMGHHREPRWPTGLVGSITHCDGYRAAAVAAVAEVLAVGLDAEPDRPLPAEVGRLAFTDADRAASGRLPPYRNWDRVAFSARESVFKAWFGVTGRWLDFADALIQLLPDGPDSGRFTASIGPGVAGAAEFERAVGTAVLAGRFRCTPSRPPTRPSTGPPTEVPGLVLTGVVLRQPDRRAPATGTASPIWGG